MSQSSLVLYTLIQDINPQVESKRLKNELIHLLQNKQLISDSIVEHTNDYFYSGDEFLRYIVFLGCSPDITLRPPVNINKADTTGFLSSFTHFYIPDISPSIELVSGSNTRIPLCSVCKKEMRKWQDQRPYTNGTIQCEYCNNTHTISSINWRKTAALCNFRVEITKIFPSEALPDDSITTALELLTGTEWQFAYIIKPSNYSA